MSADLPLEFVDTNILIYAFDRSAGSKHQRAMALVTDLWKSRRGCLSVQVLQEFYVVGTRKLSGVQPADLRTIVRDLSAWRIHVPTPSDVLDAAELHERAQVSFWDAMILQSALALHCSVVWSEDLNAGQKFASVHVQNPLLG